MGNPSVCRDCGEEIETYHDLDAEIIAFTLPRLKKFREDVVSYPPSMESAEEWKAALDKMIWSMETFLEQDEEPDFDKVMAEADRMQEGFVLFGEYLTMLWT